MALLVSLPLRPASTDNQTTPVHNGIEQTPKSFTIAEIAPISAVYMFAMWCSNEAIKYVSYPMQTLGKSCKMIPVMIGQVVFDGRRHSAYKYACVIVMAAGVAAFNLSRMSSKKSKGPSAGSDDEGMDAWM